MAFNSAITLPVFVIFLEPKVGPNTQDPASNPVTRLPEDFSELSRGVLILTPVNIRADRFFGINGMGSHVEPLASKGGPIVFQPYPVSDHNVLYVSYGHLIIIHLGLLLLMIPLNLNHIFKPIAQKSVQILL